jgi:predicted anti-sigma-YlaC factor YlaD
MRCESVRLAVSASLDAEPAPVPADIVERHLAECGPCRAWADDAQALHRSVRLTAAIDEPDRTAAILAALPTRTVPAGADRATVLRVFTLVVAALQMIAAIPMFFATDMMGGHLERHIAVSAVAMAVGLIVAAARPERARTMLPILSVLVVGLAVSCLGDILAGRPVPGSILMHGADFAGLAAVWMLMRLDPEVSSRGRLVLR